MRKLDIDIVPLEAWPSADRAAWRTATADGGMFSDNGALFGLAPRHLQHMLAAYGRWLGFLAEQPAAGSLQSGLDYLDDRQFIDAYLARLAPVAPYTTRNYLAELLTVSRAMRPGSDFPVLAAAVRRLSLSARPITDKHAAMVPARDLLQLGLDLMTSAEESASTPLKRASLFRDGLAIAMLISAPIRFSNFVSIEIGCHLVRSGSQYVLCFAAEEVKNRAPLEYRLIERLTPYIAMWIDGYRPLCLERRGRWYRGDAGHHLWVSESGSPCLAGQFRHRIERQIEAHFGRRIHPHLFRDIAATSIATEIPREVGIIRNVLGHKTLRTGERHYNQARSLVASAALQDVMTRVGAPAFPSARAEGQPV